jgi:OOP family OmpA-OmpF porin
MITNKKYISFFFFVLLLNINLKAQSKLNTVSLESSYGYSGVISPYLGQYKSDFSGLTNFNLGLRVMISEKLGFRAELVTDKFENDPGGKFGVIMSRIGAQVYYNLGKDFGLPYIFNENLGLLVHVGGGYTVSRPKFASIHEKIGNIIIGVTPQVKLTEKIALFSDISYIVNTKQHYRFDGSLYNQNVESTTGFHYNISIGLMFYLGGNRHHADWY